MKRLSDFRPSSHEPRAVFLRRVLALSVLGALTLAPVAWAVSTQRLSHRSTDAFGKGELEHVTVDERGVLSLSPDWDKVLDVPDPIVWRAVSDAAGTLYLATGSDGKVYRQRSGGKLELAADFAEQQVLALAVNPQGALYAATSPDGKIYQVSDSGGPSVYADPDARYVWDMRFDDKGTLLVATGLPAMLLEVAPGGVQKTLFKSEEAHLLSLALDPKGVVYAGSAESGYVYRLPRGGGAVSVILDAPGDEVKQLLVQPDGTLVALTSGAPGTPASDERPLSGLLSRAIKGSPDKTSRETRVYRLAPGLAPEELLTATGVTGHSLGFHRGQILVGLGEEGKVVAVDAGRRLSFLADFGGEQVTAMTPGPRGSLLLAVSNPGAVFRLEDQLAERGVYTSEALDSRLFATWGRLEVAQEQPTIGVVEVETRSGNTGKPDATWSAWTGLGEAVKSPSSRYLQYRLNLKSRGEVSPRVREVALFYLPVNSRPALQNMVVLDPDVRVEKKEEYRSEPEPTGVNRVKPPKARAQVKEKEAVGNQAVRWEGTDPDGDVLTYKVELREAGAQAWRTLSDRQEEEFVNFDATAWADGWYQLRVSVRDDGSNRPEDVLTDDQLTQPFPIDHAAPVLSSLDARLEGRRAVVRLKASDKVTRVNAARYAVDGGAFVPLFPADRVFDDQEESFVFTTGELQPGDHLLVVTVEDLTGNVATAKLPLSVR